MTFWGWADQHWFVFGALAFFALLVFEGFTVNVIKLIGHLREKKP